MASGTLTVEVDVDELLQDPLTVFYMLLSEKIAKRGLPYKTYINNYREFPHNVLEVDRIFVGHFDGAEFVYGMPYHDEGRVDTGDPSFNPDAFLDEIIDGWVQP